MADPLVYTEMAEVRFLPGPCYKKMTNEDIELAEEHIKLAEDIVIEESKKSKKSKKEFKEAEFALEKAESEIEDLKND